MYKKFMILALLSISLIFIGYICINLYSNNNSEKASILSPIPDFLNVSNNKEVSSLNLWLPAIANFIFGKDEAPQISAKSALVFDLTTSKVLYEKNSKQKLPMASLTKIMTAIIALEHKKLNDSYLVVKTDLVGEDSMGLSEGEILTQEELLYGLMLPSGNDAAEVFASNYPGGRSEFIKAMNEKIMSLGLKDTNFSNPTGLEGD